MIPIAMMLSFFSALDGYGIYCQYGSVILIVFSGCRVVFFSKAVVEINSIKSSSYFLIGILVPVVSTLAVILSPPPNSDGSYVIIQGLVLFFVATSLLLHLGAHGIWWILEKFSRGFLLIVVITIIFEYNNLIDSLNFVETDAGRVRFSPFGNHPNLTGHIFSIVAISSAFIFSISKRGIYEKIIWATIFLCATFFVLAASSRGSFIGLVFAAFIVFILYAKDLSIKKRELLFSRVIIWSILVFAYKFNSLYDWFFELFELNSDYRGVGSGGTGRFDNWISILDKVNSDTIGIFIGNGLRSWNDDYYGYATDSSYLNSIWESGYFITSLLLFLIIKKIAHTFNIKTSALSCFVAAVLGFVVVESMFARYLVAVGNPGSLLVLMILSGNYKDLLNLEN